MAAALLSCPVPATSQDLGDVFDRVNDAVVVVHTSQTEYPFLTPEAPVSVGGMGSGVLVSPRQVMTAAHVVQAADAVMVEFPDGERIRAQVVSSRSAYDVALLELERAPPVEPALIGDSDAIRVGDRVFVVGAPFGQGHTLTVGHLSARRRVPGLFGATGAVEFLQTDAAINPGNSGGPMFNLAGEVVGIVSYILTQSGGFQGLGYAVSANVARQVLLEEPALWTGVEAVPLTGALAALLNVPPPGGAILVTGVAMGSLAEQLGLRPGTVPVDIAGQALMLGGDLIVGVDGTRFGADLENLDEILERIAGSPPGTEVSVAVLRAGQIVELTGITRR